MNGIHSIKLLRVMLVVFSTTAFTFAVAQESAPIALGLGRHLFLDESLVDPELSHDITHRMNPPRDLRRVMKPDQPWEALGFIFYCSVVDHDGTAMLYYGAYDAEKRKHFCLATSPDGLTWKRPELGQVDYQGNKGNNIFPLEAVEAGVFLDPHATDEHRFRLLHNRFWPDPATAGVYLSNSPDGIYWTPSEVRLLPFVPDSQPSGYWDPARQSYAIFLRAWDPRRSICRVETTDIDAPWPYDHDVPPKQVWGPNRVPTIGRELHIVMRPDERDPENLHLYTSTTFRYPWARDTYLAFPAAYFLFRGSPLADRALNSNDGTFDTQIATSRDGITWTRHREPWVQPDSLDGVPLQLVSMGSGMVRRGRELHQYFVGWPHTHGRPVVWDKDLADREVWLKKDLGGIYRATSRLDGFFSIDAGNTPAIFTTVPFTFEGTRLLLNIDTSGTGLATVALLDAEGEPIPGFTHEDCRPIHADEIDFPVEWKGHPSLASLAGKRVRLQLRLRQSKLFAVEFRE